MAAQSVAPNSRRQRQRPSAKQARLDVRMTPERKTLIERAANLEGRSLTEFVVSSAAEKAEETIRRREMMTLSARDSVAFVEAILNPPTPGERLLAAARRYREFVGE